MRAEVESESGRRSRPVSRADLQHVTAAGPLGNDENSTPAEDDQAEWARQEQQVSIEYTVFEVTSRF